jgi:hypothetical protein
LRDEARARKQRERLRHDESSEQQQRNDSQIKPTIINRYKAILRTYIILKNAFLLNS